MESGTIGKRIREVREEKGLTLRELSDRTGLTLNGISRVELGRTTPTAVTISALARGLGVEPGDLFPKANAPLYPSVSEEQRRKIEEEGDLFFHEEAVGAEHLSLKDLTDALLIHTLKRVSAVRRRLEESDYSEENKRKIGEFNGRLINEFGSELNQRLADDTHEELEEALRGLGLNGLGELYRSLGPWKNDMPLLYAAVARAYADVGVRAGWEETPHSAKQRARREREEPAPGAAEEAG